ncbi:MAG TPA: SIS domain-containing protein [Oscillospiraceae bacterium]|nr:SIS domain-containing protein [Oscillospiraceae bacterium]
MSKSIEYIENIENIIKKVLLSQMAVIDECARLFADTIKSSHNIFFFGTGHSSLLAQEVFYRAGGLVKVRAILETSLLLNESAHKSTMIERLQGYAEILFNRYEIKKGDTIVIISNSGRNGVPVDMAELCKNKGVKVVVLTSMNHTMAGKSRHKSGKRLFEFADIVLDNMGCAGDASVYFSVLQRNAAPTSTVIGALLLNAATAKAIEFLSDDGITPEVWSSSNVDGGDEINEEFIKKYKGDIISL